LNDTLTLREVPRDASEVRVFLPLTERVFGRTKPNRRPHNHLFSQLHGDVSADAEAGGIIKLRQDTDAE
jgi:hypothetical protein